MPVRRGHVAPKSTIIETIIRKFDTHNRSFLVANVHPGSCHIIYCSDGFCQMCGYSRAEVMQRPAVCEFIQGPMTSQKAISGIRDAIVASEEKHFEILYYRKDGSKFLCSEVIAPIKSEVDDVCLCIMNFEDLTVPASREDEVIPSANNRCSKRMRTSLDRARQSFRQSLKISSLRDRGNRYLSTFSDKAPEEEEEEEANPTPGLEEHVSIDVDSCAAAAGAGHLSLTGPLEDPHFVPGSPDRRGPPGAPIASPEATSQRSCLWEHFGDGSQLGRQMPHATSLDGISRPCRSPDPSSPNMNQLSAARSLAVAISSKRIPNASSDSDLARSDRGSRKSPSLSNVPSDSLRNNKCSNQDNGSAKYFQGALHTPNMGEKVTQVSRRQCK